MKTRLIHSTLALLSLVVVRGQSPSRTGEKPVELAVSVLRVSTATRGLVIRFENRSQTPLRLLRPIDGSEWGWHMPIYELTIADSSGKKIPMGSRCAFSGLYSNLKWPDDYRIQILPGDAYEITVDTCRDIPASGTYTVSFRYHYDPSVKTPRQDFGIKYPDDLWIGSAVSEARQLELRKEP